MGMQGTGRFLCIASVAYHLVKRFGSLEVRFGLSSYVHPITGLSQISVNTRTGDLG
jgi:hypothetical protein